MKINMAEPELCGIEIKAAVDYNTVNSADL